MLNDPSRSGKAPVEVNGLLRLILELVFFTSVVFMLYDLSYMKLSIIIALIIIIHYGLSYDRVLWLLKQKKGK